MKFQRIESGRGHYYKLDGERLDGVTSLLGDGMRKGGNRGV